MEINVPHRSKLRTTLGIVWFVIFIVVGIWIVNDQRAELGGIDKVFSNLNYWYLIPALFLEAGSMAAYAQLQRSVLSAGKVDPGFWRIAAVFLGSNSITNVIPGGPAFASIYLYRRFRNFGSSEGLAGWSIFTTNVLAAFSLLVLAGVGLAIAEGSVSGVSLLGALVIVALVLIIGLLLVTRASRVLSILVNLFNFLEMRATASWKITKKLRNLHSDLSDISPPNSILLTAFGWGLFNWILDATVLVFAYLATRAAVPFEGLLIAYSAGQLAANLPITPGGLGVVEGSISIALVAYGGNQEATVAAVLLYRLFSFWIWLLPGFGCYLFIRIQERAKLQKILPRSFIHGEEV